MIGGRGFLGFVLIAIARMDILYMFYQFQDPIKVIRRYEGCYYTRLESYYIIFYFETDWSRIRPLPSSTLIVCVCVHFFSCIYNKILIYMCMEFLFLLLLAVTYRHCKSLILLFSYLWIEHAMLYTIIITIIILLLLECLWAT